MKLNVLLFIFGLCAQCAIADISLELRGKNRHGSYLPPLPAYQHLAHNNHHQRQLFDEANIGNSRYQIFEVHNHYELPTTPVGSGKHAANFVTTTRPGGYLPPHEEIHIHPANAPDQNDDDLDVSFLEFGTSEATHQRYSLTTSVANLPGPTVMSFASNYKQSQQQPQPQQQQHHHHHHNLQHHQHERYKSGSTMYLPPTLSHVGRQHHLSHTQTHTSQLPVPTTTTNTNTETETETVEQQLHQQQPQPTVALQPQSFQALGYLPPRPFQTKQQQQQQLQVQTMQQQYQHHQKLPAPSDQPQYQYHHRQQLVHYQPQKDSRQLTPIAPLAAPSYYLPPTAQTAAALQPHKTHTHAKAQQQMPPIPEPLPTPMYQTLDYLPPSQTTVKSDAQTQVAEVARQQNDNVYSAPGYLPPGYDNPDAEHQKQVVQQEPQITQLQQQAVTTQAQINVTPTYLPPGYDFDNPEERVQQAQQHLQQNVQHQQQHIQQQQLPHVEIQQQQQQQPLPLEPKYQASGYLPPGYDFVNPTEGQQQQEISEQHQQQQQQPNQFSQMQQQIELPRQQQVLIAAPTLPTHFGALPEGYEFTKPENAEEAISELHSLQRQTQLLKEQQQQHQNIVQPQIQTANREQNSDFIYSTHNPETPQLPSNNEITTSLRRQQPYQAVPTPTYIYPLSSYMTTVQPYARYGYQRQQQPQQQHHHQNQQPYRPQQSQLQPSVTQHAIAEAPMYRENAKLSALAYAPAMPYSPNEVFDIQTKPQRQRFGTQGQSKQLSRQAQQSLQKFMPKDISITLSESSPSPLPAPILATVTPPIVSHGKIRTVQIVQPNAVKTLKVLETLDHVGIKTIKVLGPSREQPIGSHHIVKVVSREAQNGVATDVSHLVKIYHDQKEIIPPQVQPQSAR